MTERDQAHGKEAAHGRPPRRAYLLIAKLLTQDGMEREFLIRNISDHGIGGEIREHHQMKTGDPVSILLTENLKLEGIVKWARWSAIGIRLREEIGAANMRQLVSPAGRSDEDWEVSRLHRVDPPEATTRIKRRLL